MAKPREGNHEDRLNRFARGELSAAEARALARESLDDTELFEELTYTAVAKRGSEALAGVPRRAARIPRPKLILLSGAIAAAIVAAFSVSLLRPARKPVPASTSTGRTEPQIHATLSFNGEAVRPVLLASNLQPDDEGPQITFRGQDSGLRAPRTSGSILSIDDSGAAIDLGSLDGIAGGSELPVYRGDAKQPVGKLAVKAVFRERARGNMRGFRQIQVGDRIEIPPSLHFAALLAQVDALRERRDSERARTVAGQALALAEAKSMATRDRRQALVRLARLEAQAGSLDEAERHYEAAANSLDEDPTATEDDQCAVWNSLAALRILRGNTSGGETLLKKVLSVGRVPGMARAEGVNDLGVLAELRGDRQTAAARYAEAVHMLDALPAASARQKQAVESNLRRAGGMR